MWWRACVLCVVVGTADSITGVALYLVSCAGLPPASPTSRPLQAQAAQVEFYTATASISFTHSCIDLLIVRTASTCPIHRHRCTHAHNCMNPQILADFHDAGRTCGCADACWTSVSASPRAPLPPPPQGTGPGTLLCCSQCCHCSSFACVCHCQGVFVCLFTLLFA